MYFNLRNANKLKFKSNNSTAAEEICEILCKMIDEHEYNDQQLYNHEETAIYYIMLPTKSLDSIFQHPVE
jgi:hypothetical protein